MHRHAISSCVLSAVLAASMSFACGDDTSASDEGNDGRALGQCGALDREVIDREKLDLLFVIDNSGSMEQEQAKLAEQIPGLLSKVTSGTTESGESFTAFRDLHVGVITTDMGMSGSTNGLRPCNGLGDDGILRKKGSASCSVDAALGYLHYTPEGGGVEGLVSDLVCLAQVGVQGCGFEQPLEAMFKALAPSSNTSFVGQRSGHGDAANNGFLRSDATLAIVHLTDEDDCSVTEKGLALFDEETRDPGIIEPGTGKPLGLNIRCAFGAPEQRVSQAEAAGHIQPTERYVTDFRQAVKPNNPGAVLYFAITGIPDGTEGMSLQDVLNHPRMGFEADTNWFSGDVTDINAIARDACRQCVTKTGEECANEPLILDENEVPGPNPEVITAAKPGVRMVRVAQGFGENGFVQSICAESFAPAISTLVQKIVKVQSAEPAQHANCRL